LANGQTGQDTGTLPPGASFLTNGSDNGLLNNFIQPALGCAVLCARSDRWWRISVSLALNELQRAAARAGCPVPQNDPMVLVNARKSSAKTNLYRLGVNQPFTFQDISAVYCQNLMLYAPSGSLWTGNLRWVSRPGYCSGTGFGTVPSVRLAASLVNLNCPSVARSLTHRGAATTTTPPGPPTARGQFW